MTSSSFRQVFICAGSSCNRCHRSSKPYEKEQRENNCVFANGSLSRIIKESEEESKDWKMADQAQARCRGCDYGSPRIKDYLESEGISFA